MQFRRRGLSAYCALVFPTLFLLNLLAASAHAQTFPTPDYFRRQFMRPPAPQLPASAGLREHVADGKLRLTVADTVRLVLENNTDVQINRLNYETSQFGILRAYQPFDPVFNGSFNATRANNPTASQLDGAQRLSTLNQQTQFSWAQAFQTGTRFTVGFNAGKNSTNSVFSTFNPSISSSLNFNVTQPLLRNFGLFPNRAPIVIARRSQRQSLETFRAQLSDAFRAAIDQYWGVVQARENLNVLRKSLEQAEATYAQNKRALELGALPPLDIYRSESQVATRRVAVIQSEYQLKQLEDDFRRTIGADLDPYLRALDLDLSDTPEPVGELPSMDSQQALELAMARRPELSALRQQLANDGDSVRLAQNSRRPDLNLTGFYTSSGLGGNAIDTSTVPPTVLSRGGLHDALEQVGGFDFPTYGFSIQLRLPVRNRAAEADMGTALVAQRRSLFSLRQREQAITLEVRNAVHQLEQAKLSMAAARIARDLAQKNLAAEQRKYELGAQTIFFVLDAQTQLAQAEQDLLRARVDYQRSLAALDRATGTLLERNNVRIDDKP